MQTSENGDGVRDEGREMKWWGDEDRIDVWCPGQPRVNNAVVL